MTIRRSNVRAVVAGLLFGSIAVACHDRSPTEPEQPATGPRVSNASMTPSDGIIGVGDTIRFTVTLLDSALQLITSRRPAWASSNPSAATVDSNGTVRGRAPGATVIAMVVDGVRRTANVVVQAPIAEFAITPALIPLGSDPLVRAIFRDSAGRELLVPSIPLRLTDTSIAVLYANADPVFDLHAFRTKAMGSVTAIATVQGREYQTTIRIGDPVIDTIAPNLRAVLIPVGTSRTLVVRTLVRAGVTDSRGVAYSPTWTSSNPSVIAVDSTGRVTALAEGDATVRATALGHTGEMSVHAFRYQNQPRFVSVVTGMDRSCALDASGAAYCWGAVVGSAFGSADQVEIVNDPAGTRLSTVPIPVSGGIRFASLANGPAVGQSCGVGLDGETYCWTNDVAPQRVPGGIRFATLTIGAHHVCGLTSSGNAYCWGANASGQLGNGSTAPATSPQPVVGGAGLAFTAIAAATAETCGLAVSGEVYCWGDIGSQTVPPALLVVTRLTTALRFKSIALGDRWQCGIALDDLVYCWGPFGNGFLVPVNVDQQTKMATLGVGRWMICGIRQIGGAACLVTNANTKSGFQPVDGDPGIRSLSVGAAACGFAADGFLYCWGGNNVGQAGGLPVELIIKFVRFMSFVPFTYEEGVSRPTRVTGQPSSFSGQVGDGTTMIEARPHASRYP